MATITLDKPEAIRAKVTDAIEEGKYAAARRFREGKREFEALKDKTIYRVRKAPLAAVGVTFATGLLFGAVLGWFGAHKRQA